MTERPWLTWQATNRKLGTGDGIVAAQLQPPLAKP